MNAKPKDYIDTSIWIGSFVEAEEDCESYLRRVGYKNNNNGLIYHFVLSELMVDVEDIHPGFTQSLREEIIGTVMERINHLRTEGRLKILKIEECVIDAGLLEEIQSIENQLSYDDALHLHMAIKSGCQRFVTTDELFNNQNKKKGSKVLLEFLKKKYGLNVKHIVKI